MVFRGVWHSGSWPTAGAGSRSAGATLQTGARRAYDAIAPLYDEFTAHHRYEELMGELLPALERHDLAGNRLLDVGCGTGKSLIPMLERGWQVAGCDISAAMIEVAKGKVGEAVSLALADMRTLPHFGYFDLVWAIDDAVNNLLDPEDLEAALQGMRRNLALGGLLLFDLNTLRAYREFFAESETIERDGLRLIRTGLTPPGQPPGAVWEAQFEAVGGGQEQPIEPHVHRQRHFPEQEVLAALQSVGLECLDVFGQSQEGPGMQKPLDESHHTKAIYIARERC